MFVILCVISTHIAVKVRQFDATVNAYPFRNPKKYGV